MIKEAHGAIGSGPQEWELQQHLEVGGFTSAMLWPVALPMLYHGWQKEEAAVERNSGCIKQVPAPAHLGSS